MMWNMPFETMHSWGAWGWFGPFHFAAPILFWALVITAVVFLVRRGVRWGNQPSLAGQRVPGFEVLEERYARGEINRDEFLQKKADIKG